MTNGIYRKKVQKSKHLLYKHQAWGIDRAIVEELINRDCTEVRILDTENDIVYKIGFDKFRAYALEDDFGFGVQKFLPLHYWETGKRTTT